MISWTKWHEEEAPHVSLDVSNNPERTYEKHIDLFETLHNTSAMCLDFPAI